MFYYISIAIGVIGAIILLRCTSYEDYLEPLTGDYVFPSALPGLQIPRSPTWPLPGSMNKNE